MRAMPAPGPAAPPGQRDEEQREGDLGACAIGPRREITQSMLGVPPPATTCGKEDWRAFSRSAPRRGPDGPFT